MKWFAIIIFSTNYAGDVSITPVESEAHCNDLIITISENEKLYSYLSKVVLEKSFCVSIPK